MLSRPGVRASCGLMPSTPTQNRLDVPAMSTAQPGSVRPAASADCWMSPAPAASGVPARSPVRAAIASLR